MSKENRSKYFQTALANSSLQSRIFVKTSFDIADRLSEIIEDNQVEEYAKKLNVPIVKLRYYLCGTHDFTIRELINLEIVLGIKLVTFHE